MQYQRSPDPKASVMKANQTTAIFGEEKSKAQEFAVERLKRPDIVLFCNPRTLVMVSLSDDGRLSCDPQVCIPFSPFFDLSQLGIANEF